MSRRGHITFTESTDVARVSWNFWKGARWKHHDSHRLETFLQRYVVWVFFLQKSRGLPDTLGYFLGNLLLDGNIMVN